MPPGGDTKRTPPRYGLTVGDRFVRFPGFMSTLIRLGLLFPLARLTRGMTLGVQAVVEDAEGRVLLVRQSYSTRWQFPGGGVDPGESLCEAVEREVMEEAGIVCTAPPTLLSVYTNFRTFPGDHIALFRATDWQQPHPPGPNREIVAHGFFARDALPADTATSVHRRLAEWQDGEKPSRDW